MIFSDRAGKISVFCKNSNANVQNHTFSSVAKESGGYFHHGYFNSCAQKASEFL